MLFEIIKNLYFIFVSAFFAGGLIFIIYLVIEGEIRLRKYPDSPWLWTKEWERKRFQRPHGYLEIVFWVFLILFLILVGCILFYGNYKPNITSPFLLVCFYLFVITACIVTVIGLQTIIRLTWIGLVQWWKCGFTVLEIDQLPIKTGEAFTGTVTIQSSKYLNSADNLEIRLCCYKNHIKSYKRDEVLYHRYENEVKPEFKNGQAIIPININIPEEAHPTELHGYRKDQYLYSWRVEIQSIGNHFNYYTEITVPVF